MSKFAFFSVAFLQNSRIFLLLFYEICVFKWFFGETCAFFMIDSITIDSFYHSTAFSTNSCFFSGIFSKKIRFLLRSFGEILDLFCYALTKFAFFSQPFYGIRCFFKIICPNQTLLRCPWSKLASYRYPSTKFAFSARPLAECMLLSQYFVQILISSSVVGRYLRFLCSPLTKFAFLRSLFEVFIFSAFWLNSNFWQLVEGICIFSVAFWRNTCFFPIFWRNLRSFRGFLIKFVFFRQFFDEIHVFSCVIGKNSHFLYDRLVKFYILSCAI